MKLILDECTWSHVESIHLQECNFVAAALLLFFFHFLMDTIWEMSRNYMQNNLHRFLGRWPLISITHTTYRKSNTNQPRPATPPTRQQTTANNTISIEATDLYPSVDKESQDDHPTNQHFMLVGTRKYLMILLPWLFEGRGRQKEYIPRSEEIIT